MRIELHKRVFLNFVLVIALFEILGSMVGARLISRTTLNEAQRRVSLDLRSAWSVLQSELDKLALYVSVLGTGKRIKDAYAAPDSQAYRAHHLKLSDGSVVLILTHSSQDLLCIVRGNDCYKCRLDGDIERVKPKNEGVMEVSK